MPGSLYLGNYRFDKYLGNLCFFPCVKILLFYMDCKPEEKKLDLMANTDTVAFGSLQ